jgi:hypothetical protein
MIAKKARIQLSCKSWQEFIGAVEQLAHQVLVRFPKKSLIDAHNQVQKLEALVEKLLNNLHSTVCTAYTKQKFLPNDNTFFGLWKHNSRLKNLMFVLFLLSTPSLLVIPLSFHELVPLLLCYLLNLFVALSVLFH